jgi:hypothetical protein
MLRREALFPSSFAGEKNLESMFTSSTFYLENMKKKKV